MQIRFGFLILLFCFLFTPTSFKGQIPVHTFPYWESFDGTGFLPDDSSSNPGIPIILLANQWENNQLDDGQDWAIRSAPTASSNTGPLSDHSTGTGNYLFVEDGFGNFADVSLITPEFQLDSLLCPTFSFWVHHHSSVSLSNVLHVDIWDGTNWQLDIVPPIFSTINAWMETTIDLSAYLGIIKIRFRGNNGITGFHNDIAIDDVRMFDANNNDLVVAEVTVPKEGCNLSANEVLKISLVNQSCAPQTQIPVKYKLNGGLIATETIAGPLLAGDTLNYTFSTNADLSLPGTYQITLEVDQPGDFIAQNNAISREVIHYPAPQILSPIAPDTICLDEMAMFHADGNDGLILWYDSLLLSPLAVGDDFQTLHLNQSTTYYAAATTAPKDSLGTYFSQQFAGLGNYFDIVAAKALAIDSFAVHTQRMDSLKVEIYYKEGSYAGFENNVSPWNFLGDIEVLGRGRNELTKVPLGNLGMLSGDTLGILIVLEGMSGYTNGNFSFDNEEMKINTGPGINTIWTGSLFPTRAWNGKVYYRSVLCESSPVPVFAYLPPSAIADLGPDTSLCGGDFVTINAGQGNTFLWSTGATSQQVQVDSSGVYSVEKTNESGCISSDSISIIFWPELDVSADSLQNPTCSGYANGEISLSIKGGQAPYSILWNTGDSIAALSGLAAGIYTWAIMDGNGCTQNDSLELTEPDSLTISVESFGDASCINDSNGFISLIPQGGTTPYSFFWSSGSIEEDIFNLTPGIYSVQWEDANGCVGDSITQEISFTDPIPTAGFSYTFLSGTTVAFNDTSLESTSRRWDFGDGSQIQNNASPTHTYVQNGQYQVQLIAENDCGEDTTVSAVSISQVGLETTINSNVVVYPNPTHRSVNIKSSDFLYGPIRIILVDIYGKKVHETQVSELVQESPYTISWDVSLTSGIYWIQLKSADWQLIRKLRIE